MTKGELFAFAIASALIFALGVSMPYPAREIRLIGECNGKFYGAMEESDFPDGCAWVEPIRYDVE